MKKIITLCFLLLALIVPNFAQKRKKRKVIIPDKVVFAVLNDGKTLEPVAKLDGRKLMQTVSGSDNDEKLKFFNRTYYKPKTNYSLIFGGKVSGTVSVVKNDTSSDCGKNMAEAITKSTRAKLKGLVMGLATDIKLFRKTSGVRRLPTPTERAEVEKLVTDEFAQNNVSGKKLEYLNLTALDIDNDGKIEFVGTFWMATSPTERALLFFIADTVRDGKLSLGFKEFRTVKKEEVMSGEIKDVDEGMYHELLLDVLDYNNDGVSEIFSYVQSFEGAGFNVYQRNEGTWEKVLESSNYHCGY